MFVRTMTVALYCAHNENWNVKEEMQGWDVHDDTIAKLVAIHHMSRHTTDVTGRARSLTCYLIETEGSSHPSCLISPCAFVFPLLVCVVSNVFHYLERPRGSAPQTLGGSKGRGSRRMFWVLAPGDVVGKPVK